MKVLAIIGSPRKGNTYEIVRLVEGKMKSLGDVEFEYVFLRDVNLGECRGCQACITRGEDVCPLKDDRADLERKMMEADGFILASPVYALQVTALMKRFLDHFAYLFHRPRLFGKKALVIASAAGGMKESAKLLADNARAWGCDVVARLATVPPAYPLSKGLGRKTLAAIDRAAVRFYDALKTGRRAAPSLYDLVYFRVWQVNALNTGAGNPTDLAYWKERGWTEAEYYWDAPVGAAKRLAARAVGALIRRFIRSAFSGGAG